ncbi:sensor domain-containing diguanylate cyclase [Nocardia aurea]|uniref:sensor domain-containing diguanylate cyclase n=1 Tax=Nocardia aurea TaxID=2144174 RepID=UPI000D69CF73|nr:sensor domain-containing diguanylate cyclase [Nocardia aurea]
MEELLRSDLISRWWQVLNPTGDAAISFLQARDVLDDLVAALEAGLTADPFNAAVGLRVGERVAALGFIDPGVPAASVEVLHGLAERGVAGLAQTVAERRITALLVAVGQGHQRSSRPEAFSVPVGADAADMRAAGADERGDRFRMVFDHLAVAVAIGDTEGNLVEVNQCLADMIGVRIEELRGCSIFRFAHPDDAAEIDNLVFDRLVRARQGTVRLERRIVRAIGEVVWVAFSITFVRGAHGQADYLLAVGEDVTQRHRLQEELHWQARHDQLTGLSNRRHLLEEIEKMGAIAGHDGRVGLCFVDLDRFKEINDCYGHGVGDQVLRAVATRMRDSLAAEGSLLARLGGDEFVVLISPPVDVDSVGGVADTLVSALADPILVGEHSVQVSASVGAVVTVVAGVRPEELLDAADRELYRAKNSGKERWALQVLDTGTHTKRDAGNI